MLPFIHSLRAACQCVRLWHVAEHQAGLWTQDLDVAHTDDVW